MLAISRGMVPIIRSILENLLGPEDAARIEIVANEVQVQADGKFSIQFRHPESGFGHDKSKALRIYRELQPKPTIFFAGDGVSRHLTLLYIIIPILVHRYRTCASFT